MTVNEALQNLCKNLSTWWFWVQLSWKMSSCPLVFERWRCVRWAFAKVLQVTLWSRQRPEKQNTCGKAHFSSCFSSALDHSITLMTRDLLVLLWFFWNQSLPVSCPDDFCPYLLTSKSCTPSSLFLLRWIPETQRLRGKKLSLLLSLPSCSGGKMIDKETCLCCSQRGTWSGGVS